VAELPWQSRVPAWMSVQPKEKEKEKEKEKA
jgi:hypothetical protein